MSILLNVTSVELPEKLAIGLMLALTLVSPVVLWKARVFQAGAVLGPRRMRPEEMPWQMLTILFCGMLAFGASLAASGMMIGIQRSTPVSQEPVPAGRVQPVLTDSQLAILVSVPPLVGVLVLIGSHLMLRPGGLELLGLGWRRFLSGMGQGMVGLIVALPLVFWTSLLTEYIYRMIGYQHPQEHDLLRVIYGVDDLITGVALGVAIVVIAPVAEEVLFRGHLQTILAQSRLPWGHTAKRGFEVLPLEEPDVPPSKNPNFRLTSDTSANIAENVPPSPLRIWIGVILASIAFAAVHDKWTIPPIVVLSICIAYVYERTGNLWAAIMMHATFNGLSTLFYFFQTR